MRREKGRGRRCVEGACWRWSEEPATSDVAAALEGMTFIEEGVEADGNV